MTGLFLQCIVLCKPVMLPGFGRILDDDYVISRSHQVQDLWWFGPVRAAVGGVFIWINTRNNANSGFDVTDLNQGKGATVCVSICVCICKNKTILTYLIHITCHFMLILFITGCEQTRIGCLEVRGAWSPVRSKRKSPKVKGNFPQINERHIKSLVE